MINEKFLVNYIHIPTCDHINYLGKKEKKNMVKILKNIDFLGLSTWVPLTCIDVEMLH